MVTKQTYNEIWRNLLNAARAIHYYQALCDHYRSRNRVLKFLLFFCGGMILVSALLATRWDVVLLKEALPFFSVATVLLVYLDYFVLGYSKKIAPLSQVRAGCSQLEGEWQKLWYDVKRGDVDEGAIRVRIGELNGRVREVTEEHHNICAVNQKLNKKSAAVAYRVVQNRYAYD